LFLQLRKGTQERERLFLSLDTTIVLGNDIFMAKILTTKDILLLTLAGIGDLFQEVNDPLEILSNGYREMYGFVPGRYVRRNFYQAVWRSLRTGDIEKVIKNNKQYLVLTTNGKEKVRREFPLTKFSKSWNKKWVILIFDIEEKSRKLRNRLRSKLKNIGFGMLQESVWITPLPIIGELKDFAQSNNLTDYVFVLEVAGVLLGEPKELARRVWRLDQLEEMQIKLEKEKREIDNHLKTIDGRPTFRERLSMGNNRKDKNNRENNRKFKEFYDMQKLYDRKKEIKKKEMELILSLPFLYEELLPQSLNKLL